METVRGINPELTIQVQNPYSRSRGNIMPDQGQQEAASGALSRGQARTENEAHRAGGSSGSTPTSRVTPAEMQEARARMRLRMSGADMVEGLAGGKPRAPGRPIRVDEFKEEYRPEYDQAKNASLSDFGRVSEAARLLDKESLNEDQQKALLKAHNTKDPLEKVRILREDDVFDRAQTRILIESHLAGMMPPTSSTNSIQYDQEINTIIAGLDPNSFTNTDLRDVARKMKDLYGADYLDNKMLLDFYGKIRGIGQTGIEDGTIDPTQVKELQNKITQIIQLDDLRTGRTKRDFSSQIGEYENLKKELEDAKGTNDSDQIREAEKRKRDFVRKIASEINLQSGTYDEVITMVIDEGNSLEYLINRIVSAPLDSETGDWSLGFYGKQNLDSITNILRTQKENFVGKTEEETQKVRTRRNIDYQAALEIEQAISLVHDVNRSIIDADLGLFQKIAGRLTDEKLSRLSRVKGVGVVSRLLETEYGSLLANDTWINSQNLTALMGRVRDPQSGLLREDQSQSALESFRGLVETANKRVNDPNTPEELRKLGEMEPWEIDWAFNIGKAMFNLWLRGAEWISQGKPQKGDKGYVSFPQESIVRILNYPQYMLQRFDISPSRGGKAFLDNAIQAYQATRGEDGYGHMGLSQIGGKKIENFEMPDMTGVRGWWASWRGRQLIMETVPIQFRPRGLVGGAVIEREGKTFNPGEITDLAMLLDTGSFESEGTKINGKTFDHLSDAEKTDYIVSIFLDGNGNLRADFNRGLAASIYFGLKPSAYGDHPDGRELLAAKEHIRKLIWEKAAVENPLGVVPFLHGLKYAGGREVKIMPGRGASAEEQARWREFSRKLFQLNEIKMQRIKALEPRLVRGTDKARDQAIRIMGEETLDNIIAEEARRGADGIKFTPYEQELLRKIRQEGKRAAPHLANVRFAYAPFLNDMPMEKVDYGIVGAEGYRRMINDTGGFSGANEALIKLMDNPSKFKEATEINEIIEPFISGVGGILGTDVGQRKGYVWLESTLDMLERGSNAPVHKVPLFPGVKFDVPVIGSVGIGPKKLELKTLARVEKKLRQFTPFAGAFEFFHVPNSKAQKYAGHLAAAFNAQELFHAGEEAVHAGIISHEEEKKWRKRFGGHRAQVIKSIIRFLLAGLFVATADVPKRSFKDLKL